jgi:hypothetical protein
MPCGIVGMHELLLRTPAATAPCCATPLYIFLRPDASGKRATTVRDGSPNNHREDVLTLL